MFIAVFALGSCHRSTPANVIYPATENSPQSPNSVSEPGIYAAILSGLELGPDLRVGPHETLLLAIATSKPRATDILMSDPSIKPEAIVDLTNENLTTAALPTPLDVYIKLKLVPNAERSNAGLNRLRRENPATTGILHLSRIGYSADLTQALVYTNFEHWDDSTVEQFAVVKLQTRENALTVKWITVPSPAAHPASFLADLTPDFVCHHVADIKTMPFQDEPVDDAIYNGIMRAGKKIVPCLIEQITDRRPMDNPETTPVSGLTVGAIAYFLVIDITKLEFLEPLPRYVRQHYENEGVFAFLRYIESASHRRALRNWLRAWNGHRRI